MDYYHDYYHEPVLLNEVMAGLAPRPNESFIDATVGSGGHAAAILARIAPRGRLLAIDRDPAALIAARRRLKEFKNRLIIIHGSYSNLTNYALSHGFTQLAGILFDLGFSSPQLKDKKRGFSFQINAPLDLRYDPTSAQPAWALLQQLSEAELVKIFRDYGDIARPSALARAIVRARLVTPLRTTYALREVVEKVMPRGRRSLIPATLVWQALRIAVNDEFNELRAALPQAVDLLAPAGRLAIISFHSGEDRIVKKFLRQAAVTCLCPPAAPVCRCGHEPQLKIVNSRPIRPLATELRRNPRAHSGKLRLAIKLNASSSSSQNSSSQ